MATIALYANKVNQMPGLIKNVKKSVTDYKSELSKLRKKTLSVDRKVCNMDDILSQVQSATQTQEKKIQFLDKVSKDSEEFITDTVRIDSNVADVVNKRKNDFYEKYYYLKPECEKSGWEKIKDKCKKVGEWCKEHWRIIVAAVAVIIAVVVACVCPVLAPILIAAGKAALWGGAIGGLMGGLSSMRAGGSFWEGFEKGAFTGAVMGALGTFAGAAVGLAGSATGTFLANLSSNSCRILQFLNVTSKVTGGITALLGGFDTLSMVSEIFCPGNALSRFNESLHSNALFNGFQQVVGFTAIFTGAAYHQLNKYPTTCFVAGTMILTTMGLVAIENIKVGDRVIATDMLDFTTTEKIVTQTYIHKAEKLIHLTIHNEKITTTPDHPFYVKNQGFTNAGDLEVGDLIVNAAGDSCIVEMACLEVVEKPENVYNFQVEDYHTYYVGENRVLVHNNGGCPLEKVEYGEHYTRDKNTHKKVLKPNVEYTTDAGYKYATDSKGRISKVTGSLSEGKSKRNQYAQSNVGKGSGRLSTDQGGHLIARIFKGSGDLDNLVPMDGKLNQGDWKSMENGWAKALKAGKKVDVKVDAHYSGVSKRPDSFTVKYKVGNGKWAKRTFNN